MAFGYKVYFTERQRNRVMCWDPDGGEARAVAGGEQVQEGDQALRNPYGLAVDAQGRLLIADKRHSRLARLEKGRLETVRTRDADGHRKHRFIGRIDSPVNPTSIHVRPDGSLLVAYSDDFTIYRVQKDGKLELILGLPPTKQAVFRGYFATVPAAALAETPLNMPTCVVEDRQGTIYFIERGYNVVRRYRPGGDLESVFVRRDRRPESLPKKLTTENSWPVFPTGLALDAQGRLYVSDGVYASVFVVEPGNKEVRRIAVGEEGRCRPAALAFGPDGVLWVLDTGEGRVVGFRRSTLGRWKALASPQWKTEIDGVYCAAMGGAGIACGARE